MKTDRNGGFTLIELVIVIAIVAILAGVSIPVYTGYIQKANEAADLQLLGAVNTAFAAACAERGVSPEHIRTAASGIGLDRNRFVVAVPNPLNDAFMTYFGQNRAKPFRQYSALYYDAGSGRFVAFNSVTGRIEGAVSDFTTFHVRVNEKEHEVTVRNTDLAAISASAFGPGGSVTVPQLMKTVTNLVEKTGDAALLVNEQDYQALVEMTVNELSQAQTPGTEEAVELSAEAERNLLVLYAAQHMDSVETDKVASSLGQGKLGALISGDAGDSASAMALAYGMATAYYYRSHEGGAAAPVKEEILQIMRTDEAFQDYVRSAEGRADMQGYLSCMKILNDSMGEGNIEYSYIAENGFEKTDVIQALSTIFGQDPESV